MARSLEEVMGDLASARLAWDSAVEARRVAVAAVADLRARAVAGDPRVSAADLATATDAASFAELGIPARQQAVEALERERLVAETERWADGIRATLPALQADVVAAFSDIEAALDRLVTAWRVHAGFVGQTSLRVAHSGGARDVTPRVSHGAHGVRVDGVVLRALPVHDPLDRLVQQCHQRLLSGQPKALSS